MAASEDPKMEKQRQDQTATVMGQQLKLASLMQSGGLIVIGETVVTLHEEAPDTQSWVTIGYGIPCLSASEEQLSISITDIDDGETQHEFCLSSKEDYRQLDRHFHVLTTGTDDKKCTYGMTFAHEMVAERFFAAVKQLAPCEAKSKRTRYAHRQVVSIEATDLPSLHGTRGLHVEEAGALTASGRFKSELEESTGGMDYHAVQLQREKPLVEQTSDQGTQDVVEEVDHGGNHPTSYKTLKDGSRDSVDISHPTACKHVAHVGSHTPVHTLVQVIKKGEDLSSVRDSESMKQSAQPLPPPPPPPMTNFQTILEELQSLNLGETSPEEKTSKDGSDRNGAENPDNDSQTSQEKSFHKAIGKLINKKLHDEALYSKLVSFTASGREEKCEKPAKRAASVIIHDHGIVCL